jgi:hypothetical protein
VTGIVKTDMYGHKMRLLLRDGTRETVWFNAASFFFGMYMLIIMLKVSICPNEKYKISTLVVELDFDV